MLAHQHLQLKAGLLSDAFSSAECLCTVSTCINFKTNIHRVQGTAEFSSNQQTKKKRETEENIEKQKQAQRLLIIFLGFIAEGPQRGCQ